MSVIFHFCVHFFADLLNCFVVFGEGSISVTTNYGVVISNRLKLSIRDNKTFKLFYCVNYKSKNEGVCVGLFRC